MANDRMKNPDNLEGGGKQEQQSPGRNPQDEQTAGRKEEPGSGPKGKYEKEPEHRERGAGSVL